MVAQEKNSFKHLKLIFAIIICLGAGFWGSFFTTPAIPTWYASLTKPSFNPPNWLFGPVWTTLFILMGISLYLIWREGFEKPLIKKGMMIFAVQLIFNIAWSMLFFGLKSPLLGLIDIILLWLLIVSTIMTFKKINALAAYLLIPYLAWVSFASVLNFFIFRLN